MAPELPGSHSSGPAAGEGGEARGGEGDWGARSLPSAPRSVSERSRRSNCGGEPQRPRPAPRPPDWRTGHPRPQGRSRGAGLRRLGPPSLHPLLRVPQHTGMLICPMKSVFQACQPRRSTSRGCGSGERDWRTGVGIQTVPFIY